MSAAVDNLSPNTAWYTRSIVSELDRTGRCERPCASLTSRWPGRLHNAARRVGFVITTRRTSDATVVAEVVGWKA